MLPVDAFGETVKSVPISGGFFDLGFAKPERLSAGSEVEQVQAGSPAARAGLRDGDTLIQSLDLNPSYRSFRDLITLHVQHDNAPESITYDPHLGSHPGMKWTLPLREGSLPSCRGAS
jgi:S1-C subfamily serine protease